MYLLTDCFPPDLVGACLGKLLFLGGVLLVADLHSPLSVLELPLKPSVL